MLSTIVAVLAAAGVLAGVPAVSGTASPAQAADEFICNSSAVLWEVHGSSVLSRFDENAVDPTPALAGDTRVVAFRTPGGVPKLLRRVPNTAAARTAAESSGDSGAVELVEVPLQH